MIQFSELEERFNIFIERMKFQITTVYWNVRRRTKIVNFTIDCKYKNPYNYLCLIF